MKTFWIALIASTLSAIFSVGLYRMIETPKEVIIKETIPARYTNYTDELLSGERQRKFISSSPTNFIAAANNATPAVVNIKSCVNPSIGWLFLPMVQLFVSNV